MWADADRRAERREAGERGKELRERAGRQLAMARGRQKQREGRCVFVLCSPRFYTIDLQQKKNSEMAQWSGRPDDGATVGLMEPKCARVQRSVWSITSLRKSLETTKSKLGLPVIDPPLGASPVCLVVAPNWIAQKP